MENRFKVWDKKLNVMWQEIELTKLLSYLIFQIMPNADAYLALKDHFTEMVWLRSVCLKDKTGREIFEGDTLRLHFVHYNPAIFVPSLKKIIFGCESWWGEIKTLEEFTEITKDEIANSPAILLMKAMFETEKSK